MIEVSEEPLPPQDEPIKRKRGRPPGSKNKVETVGASTSGAHEQPAETTDKVETSGEIEPYPEIAPTSTPEAIFALWNSLSSRQRQFGNIYLYRDHPKLLLVKQGSRLVNENVQKFNDEDGPVTRETLWKKHRAGMFTLRLVQRIADPKGEISNAKLKLDGDYANTDDMPIFDLARLDWEHPDNQSYVRILKLRGVNPPGEHQTNEENEDMAASEVLGNIASRAIDTLSERRDQSAQPQASDNGAVKEVVSLLRETINNAKPPEQQGSVTDHVKSLVDIAKAMAPPAVNLQPFMDLQQQNNALVEQMMKKDVQRAEAETERAKQEAAELRAAMPKAKTIDEQFDDLEKAALRYKRIRGESDEPEERNVAPISAGLGFWGALPSILEKGTVMLSLLANLGFNWAVAKTGAGAAVNPATGRAETSPAEPALSVDQQEQAERMNAVIQQLVPLAAPMMRHLQQGKSGTDFAKFVFENYGPEAIAVIQNVEGGRATILGMLQGYPPVWSQVSNSEHNLQRFTLFLDQFLTYQNSTVQ